jgi:uncharacterized membrane protein
MAGACSTELEARNRAYYPAIWTSVLVGSAVLGILLRLDGIGSSLWIDEFGTLWVVEESLSAAWKRAITFQGQTPFYYTFAWLSVKLFGESEIALRLPSLFCGVATWIVLAIGSWRLFGSRAGLCAFVLAAVDWTLVHASAQARPYALAFLMLTLAIFGFLAACSNATRGARAFWVFCSAATIWTHYVFYPFVIGIVSAYLLIPYLRLRYRPSQFGRDLLVHLLLVSLALPQFVQLFARRSDLDWVSTGYTGGGLIALTLPYWPLLILGAIAVWKCDEAGKSAFWALWISIIVGSVGFLTLRVLGVNLINVRYMQGGLIPIMLLSVAGIALLNRFAASVSVVMTLFLLATALQEVKLRFGTYTRMGAEDWRQATEVLDATLEGDTLTPVLFHAGFIEEDQTPLGSPVAATRAPLRSPGRPHPGWNIVPLTLSWNHPQREAYFFDEVRARLDSVETFYLLSRSAPYAALMVEWVEQVRPGSFEAQTQEFGSVVLVTFRSTHSSGP